MKNPEEIAQWVIDNRHPKSELQKVSDAVMFTTLIYDINTYADQQTADLTREIKDLRRCLSDCERKKT